MKKNDIITTKIENLGFNGEGISHFDGTTIFVPFALPEEIVKVKILKVKGNIAFAKLVEICEKSTYRQTCECLVYGKCGGCQLQHLDYQKQLDFKKQIVENCLKKIAHLDICTENVVASPKTYHYRNKLQLPIRREKGVNKIGFFREGSHDIIEIEDCPLHPIWAKKIIKIVKNYIEENAVSCYDESTNSGLLKHLVIREVSDKLLITLVTNGNDIPRVNRLIDALKRDFNDFSLILNINNKNNNVVLGNVSKVLYGSGKIPVGEFGIFYEIGSLSFMQVNAEQKHNLYNKVFELAGVDETTVVIDGYSGAGVLTAMLAKHAKRAYGIEIVPEATQSANQLAIDNNLSNKIQNICDDCAKVLPGLIEKSKSEGAKTILVLDPPRKGVSENILQQILKSLPDKVIYISCSPQSLSRDLGILLGTLKIENSAIINSYANFSPYKLTYIAPFDMFPQTKHVETIVCLDKNSFDN